MGTAAPSGDVVIPELHDTLEWVLSSPPNVHQFEEPPIVVEIEHVKAVPTPDVH
jgi:heme/copper-type cytochrome/quinol oxidase subunit 1